MLIWDTWQLPKLRKNTVSYSCLQTAIPGGCSIMLKSTQRKTDRAFDAVGWISWGRGGLPWSCRYTTQWPSTNSPTIMYSFRRFLHTSNQWKRLQTFLQQWHWTAGWIFRIRSESIAFRRKGGTCSLLLPGWSTNPPSQSHLSYFVSSPMGLHLYSFLYISFLKYYKIIINNLNSLRK